MRHLILIALSFAASGCARSLRLPHLDLKPEVATFETGLNQRTKVFDFEIPEVKKDTQRVNSVTLKYGDTKLGGTEKQDQLSNLTVLRGGQPMMNVACRSIQDGATAFGRDFSRHTFACQAVDFTLEVQEPQDDVFVGRARLGSVELTFESSDDMEKGIPQYPTGFHLSQHGRWVATFEYFQGGKAYVNPSLSAAERDAVLSVLVVLHSTGAWLANNASRNQARPFGM
ncbi:MAG: hypothetical protein AMXMBFR34_14770 [Myxococcaceae bacterium]